MNSTATQDFTAAMKDAMGAFPMNAGAMEDSLKSTATLNEKLAGVALNAAEKSTDVASAWSKDAIARLAEVSKAKDEPADYTKAVSDYVSTSTEVATEKMAAFAEIAKKFQMDSVELMMAAGKDMTDQATGAVRKATGDTAAAVKKATAAK